MKLPKIYSISTLTLCILSYFKKNTSLTILWLHFANALRPSKCRIKGNGYTCCIFYYFIFFEREAVLSFPLSSPINRVLQKMSLLNKGKFFLLRPSISRDEKLLLAKFPPFKAYPFSLKASKNEDILNSNHIWKNKVNAAFCKLCLENCPWSSKT